jgi:hypothetical protein
VSLRTRVAINTFSLVAAPPLNSEFGGPLGTARQRRGDFMHLLDKRLSLARFVMASPASHAKLDDHSHPLCRKSYR